VAVALRGPAPRLSGDWKTMVVLGATGSAVKDRQPYQFRMYVMLCYRGIAGAHLTSNWTFALRRARSKDAAEEAGRKEPG
jgi:hypothetical protein